jgi:hypothetical protein
LRELQFWEFRDSHLGVLGQNDIWVLTSWPNIDRGRWWLPLSPGRGESCESVFARGESMHPKCFNCALTNMLFGSCRSVWIINLLINIPSSHLRASTRPYTLKVLQTKEHALTPFPFVVFTFRLAIESIKELGGASLWKLQIVCQTIPSTHELSNVSCQITYFRPWTWVFKSPIFNLNIHEDKIVKSSLWTFGFSDSYSWMI